MTYERSEKYSWDVACGDVVIQALETCQTLSHEYKKMTRVNACALLPVFVTFFPICHLRDFISFDILRPIWWQSLKRQHPLTGFVRGSLKIRRAFITHWPSTRAPLSCHPNNESSVIAWSWKSSAGFGLPSSDYPVTFCSLTLTQRIRRDVSLSFSVFLWCSRSLLTQS